MGDFPHIIIKYFIPTLLLLKKCCPHINFPSTLFTKFHTMRDDSLIRIAEFLFLISSLALVVFIMLKVTG